MYEVTDIVGICGRKNRARVLQDLDVVIYVSGAGDSVYAIFPYRTAQCLGMLYVSNDGILLSGMRRYTGGAGISACGTAAKPEMSSGCFAWRGNVDRVLDWYDM